MKTVAEYEALLAIANERIKQLEQRLLLSSEAEKGERELESAIESPDAIAWWHNASIDERGEMIEQAYYLKHPVPSPPSPQEKQGVEDKKEE